MGECRPLKPWDSWCVGPVTSGLTPTHPTWFFPAGRWGIREQTTGSSGSKLRVEVENQSQRSRQFTQVVRTVVRGSHRH